jgi:hypothetical protein
MNRPALEPARLDRTRQLTNDAIRDVSVTDYEHLIDRIELPDPDYRHVLAAAISADAQLIVTKNLRDFPAAALGSWDIEVQHPDGFLTDLHNEHPEAVAEIVTAIARAWTTDATAEDVLDSLAVDAPGAAPSCDRPVGTTPQHRTLTTRR